MASTGPALTCCKLLSCCKLTRAAPCLLPQPQLRFALQVPALLLVYVANVALLPEACRERLGGGVDSLSACVAIG